MDSARFRHFIWQALEADGHCILDVRAQVIGEHNDNMIPLQGSEVTFASGVTLSLGTVCGRRDLVCPKRSEDH